MNKNVAALISGILFGAGLLISGMADPNKVIGFLDITRLLDGSWDPSLMLVMLGALLVYIPVFHFYVKPRAESTIKLKPKPMFDNEYHLPAAKKPDGKLVLGSAIFGLGWGIAGICPGPALVNIGSLDISLGLFVISMVTGSYLGKMSLAAILSRG
ncbi:DUF6691 family protein [Shewanella violacea]|uniref:YeeE/YedE family protein n=1 Tax=Shewanella violacea (strain JCM 10179 / CIP 106290 / LMG 19151 / DSS12) TaxID=637905 RepID=D4ZG36_SHEVD|nr:DUF6691 family protein [Shewanella violacea]BAJ00635.1 YeeE/YedE family protein [Shewanella violacea DSS12]